MFGDEALQHCQVGVAASRASRSAASCRLTMPDDVELRVLADQRMSVTRTAWRSSAMRIGARVAQRVVEEPRRRASTVASTSR